MPEQYAPYSDPRGFHPPPDTSWGKLLALVPNVTHLSVVIALAEGPSLPEPVITYLGRNPGADAYGR
jgi:hypothetical protein